MSEPETPETDAEEKVSPPDPPRKKHRLRRWLLGLVALGLFGLILLVGLLWYGVSTENGTRFLLARLPGFIPGKLTLGRQTGPLIGPLALRDVHYENQGLEVTLRSLDLDWRPGKLRGRQLDIEKLRVDGVRVVLPPPAADEPSDGRLVPIHLPVNLIVRDALIRDVEIVFPPTPPPAAGQAPAPPSTPFRLDRIALDATSERLSDVVHVRRLAVDGPTFNLNAQGDLTPVGDYGIALDARANWHDPAHPPFEVAGRFDGTLEKLKIDALLSRPFTARVRGDVLTPMREVGLDLTAQVDNFDPRSIDPTYPAALIRRADVAIRGALDDFASNGLVIGTYEGVASGTVDYRLTKKGDEIAIERARLTTDKNAVIEAHGTASLAETPENTKLDLAAAWQRLSFPLEGGAPVVISRTGKGTLRGTLKDYQLEADAQVAGPNVPPGHWVVAGRGNTEKMDIRSLRADLLRGRLAATGTVAWQPQVSWKIRTTGKSLDPSAFATVSPAAADYSGRIDFTATSSGTMRDAGPFGQVDLEALSGQIRGNPLDGRIHLELAGDRYRLPRLDLRSGSARLTAAGAFTADVADLEWKLDAPNLSEALPKSGGALVAQGHLDGPWGSPRVRATAEGQSLVFSTSSVETMKLAADVDLRRDGRISIDLDAAGVASGERHFETVTLDGTGTRDAHEIKLAVASPEGTLDLALAGGLDNNTTWNGTIRRLDLKNDQTGAWGLAQPASLTAGTTRAALRDFCWTSGTARLCAEGAWSQAGPWSASGTIADLPFSLFQPFLPPDLEITGATNGTFSGQGSAQGVVTADLDLQPGPGEIRYPTEEGEKATIRFDRGIVRAKAGAAGLTGHAELTFLDTGNVRADLDLPRFNLVGAPLDSQTLNGRIVADFTSLGLLEAFVPDLRDPRGALSADLTLGGTVAKPTVRGTAKLDRGQVDIPEYGLELRQIELTATSEGQGPIAIRGGAHSGKGNVTISGTASLDGRPSRLTIEGNRFQAANTKEIKAVVSPKIEIAMQGSRIDVTGEVEVPEATFEQEKRKPAAVPVSSDVVILPPSDEIVRTPTAAPTEIHARVRVILGDKVSIKALGFSGKPKGSLLVIDEPGKATSAIGELTVEDGIYKSYGQDLKLERGRLIFAGGPIDNPGLDLKAFRKADDGTIAGINIRGTLRSPQATLYSEPPMGESEALAYLLLGHPLGQSTGEEGDLLANAANSLGLKGGNLLAKKLAARFGLEEARIESTGGLKEASVVVGKYLSPRLYVTYGLGLFEPVSTFKIRYLLGREWSLQAEQSGTATGADILYSVERGKGGKTPPPVKDKGEPAKVPAEGGGG
ncbi:MAG TPA: translocation/assembly module TamB domain-containing protein [Thermoanaerobaculia bacterium]|nr:translocation/assembly module TamB domain-containing protein [Thermoanaerobaculia bacterium]